MRPMFRGLVVLGAGVLALGSAPALAAPASFASVTAVSTATAVKPAFPIDAALIRRIKPLLAPGANVKLAAEGFKTAEQFAAVAHASHDLKIEFVSLRAKVVDHHMTLAKAIASIQPKADATSEAQRAESAARKDVSAAGGQRPRT
jgi:hypothetical protein